MCLRPKYFTQLYGLQRESILQNRNVNPHTFKDNLCLITSSLESAITQRVINFSANLALVFSIMNAGATLLIHTGINMRKLVAIFFTGLLLSGLANANAPSEEVLDAEVRRLMTQTNSKGLALAIVDKGQVTFVKAYGVRNENGDALQTDTIMYGASLTKAVFSYVVMRLVDQKKLDLDRQIASYLDKPLPEYPTEPKYAAWSDLANDDRWKKITPRMALTHSTGLANFAFVEPDNKLHIHFEPGSRYAYSGDGILLLQFAIEKGLRLDVNELTQDLIFKPLGMTRTSLIWRDDFKGNLADGWTEDGNIEEHDERSKVRAAGSMDTTIEDFSKFAAAVITGKGLSRSARVEMFGPQLRITTKQQFPTLMPELPPEQQKNNLHAGLGVVVFEGPQGKGFYKGGHNDTTANTWVCIKKGKKCVVILSNDVRSEKIFPQLVKFVLGETGVPYDWEYGFKSN